ncbi:MAG: GAF domain-containing protein, partial [Cyanobacteria bacterium P01_A01_bin.114]
MPKVLAQIASHPETGCILALHRRRVVGIATRQDVIQALAQATDWSRLRLTQIATRPVITVAQSELISDWQAVPSLLARFEHHQIAHLPVIDAQAHLVGLISYLRLLQALPAKGAETHLQQRARLLAEITLKIRQSLQLKEILHTTVHEVQRLLDVDRVLIYQVFPDGTGKTISEAVLDPYPSVLGMPFPEEVFPEDYQRLYAQGRVRAIADVHDPESGLTDCLVEFIEQWGIQSKLIVPIVHPLKPELSVGNAPLRKHLWGLLIMHHCRSPRQWAEAELDLMQQLADQISIALSQGQMVEYLEERVKLRTAELTQANHSLQQEIQERKQVETALRQSEEQLRLITNNLPVLIAYVDCHQRYRFNNQAYEAWLGHAPADIYGKSVEAVMGTDHYQAIQADIESALAGSQVTYEQELVFKDGRCHSMSVTYIPHIESTRQAAHSIKGFFALATDISDRKAIERMKDEFIAVVSHELRTPLTSIHGSLKLMATGRLGQLSEAGQQMLEVADENTDRLVRLVNNVLDLQRIESGEVTMDASACNAGELILQAAEAVQTIAQQQSIEIQTQAEPLS